MEQEAVVIYCSSFWAQTSSAFKKDQKQAEYQAALQYSCSKEIRHYTSHIHRSSMTTFQ